MPFLTCLLFVALAWTTGMARLWAEEPAGAPPILIGLLLPPEETEATSLGRGVQLGIDQANQVPGAKFSLLVRGRVGQWGSDGEEAGRMVLDDHARGLIAPPGGAASHLALQVAGRTATPVISLCPDSSVVGAGIPWMVRIVPSTDDEARLLFSTFHTNPAGRTFRWGALVSIGRAGRETARDLSQAGTATRSPLDRPVEVSPKLQDFSEITKQVLATRPDGILIWLEAKLAGRLAKSLRAAGFKGQFAGPSHFQSPIFTTNAGSAAEGFVLPSPVLDPVSQSVAARFAAVHRQQFGSEADRITRMAYDAAVLLTDQLRKSGANPSRSDFPIMSEQPGASGRLKFDRNGNRLVSLELLQFREGGFIRFASQNAQP